MYARLLVFCIIVTAASHRACGQPPEPITLDFAPQLAADSTAVRLLPADPDLKDGNAAVVMLRLIWDQQPFMQTVVPQLNEMLKLPSDDPRIVDEFNFDRFQNLLRRAAYMRDAQMLILDEPTAALDAKAEYQVFERFAALTRGRMAVLISHRFSTVRAADHIIVIHNGEIVEQGNHESLLASNGQYDSLFK